MPAWDGVLTKQDELVFAKAGFGSRQGFGERPAVVVIDVNYNFTGERPQPILEAIETSRNSCGEAGWQAVYALQRLLAAARDAGVPIFYTTNMARHQLIDTGHRAGKNPRSVEDTDETHRRRNQIVQEIAPQGGELVIEKDKASAFFGTNLIGFLVERKVDQLIVTGTSTSGCVRATVVDAWSYNLNAAVVEECVFDRGEVSHKIALFDMNAKYGDVVSLPEVQEYFAKLPQLAVR